jgi:hypothetical protein
MTMTCPPGSVACCGRYDARTLLTLQSVMRPLSAMFLLYPYPGVVFVARLTLTTRVPTVLRAWQKRRRAVPRNQKRATKVDADRALYSAGAACVADDDRQKKATVKP